MSEPDNPRRQASAAELRQQRLAAALRANLVKRKRQARARAADAPAESGVAAPDTSSSTS